MLEVETPQDMKSHIGEELGISDWVTVDQEMIDRFAEATGDHQWIHVDVERAKTEMPDGKTIAHGYLTLSLLPRLMHEIYDIKHRRHGINYGSNKIRFTNPVPAGSRVRLRPTLKSVEDVKGNGVRIITECRIEIEGQERPALVAEVISLAYG
jgi:acyl dehydratase